MQAEAIAEENVPIGQGMHRLIPGESVKVPLGVVVVVWG